MKAPAFAYARPACLDEAFELLERYGDEARILAGGQSLIPALNMRLAAPRVLIDINGLPGLSGIRVADGAITIGALTRHRMIETSPEVARQLPLLAQAMPHVAHAAIRNRGTFGGSIAFADPAAELPACCVALGTQLVIARRGAKRRVSAREFFKGLYETDLRPGELLIAGEFAPLVPGYRSAFQEFARRHGDYPIAGLAAHARLAGGTVSDAKLVFFGVGATPVLAQSAAQALEGRPIPDAIAAAQAVLHRDFEPRGDIHNSALMRLHLARVLLRRVIENLAAEQ